MEIDTWLYQMVTNIKQHPSRLRSKVIWILNVIKKYFKIGHDDLMLVTTKLLIKKDRIDTSEPSDSDKPIINSA